MKIQNLKNKAVVIATVALSLSSVSAFAVDDIAAAVAAGVTSLTAMLVSVAAIGAASLSIVIAVKTWKTIKHAFMSA